ncbi:hypothetical protein J0B02_05800 [Enterobacteriaceae bacterium YMB-R22]|uniref:hypothetical protein n=1 Tax=Tenebrionicola larvae TaxID=2815733 RepID=UPI002012ACE2|nr:hypothetical protein [Tenebrionicola larvae]MBV4412346.1 hypothetical protein [Tenebrionicola larvae]
MPGFRKKTKAVETGGTGNSKNCKRFVRTLIRMNNKIKLYEEKMCAFPHQAVFEGNVQQRLGWQPESAERYKNKEEDVELVIHVGPNTLTRNVIIKV